LNGYKAIAKILKMEGVEFITGFPNCAIHDAVAEEGIRIITFRNERVAVEAAYGYARTSFGKRIGVTSPMYGPGIENAFPGVRQAYADGAPVLVLPTGDVRRRVTTNPHFNAVSNFKEITKWADSISFADCVPEKMRRAFSYMRTGRPRPVLVDVPLDVGKEEFDDALFQYKPVKPVVPAGDPNDIKAVAKALIAAKNPVIRAGQGVLYACAWDELRQLSELLQIPVYTTLNSKSVFPEDHPLSLGAGSTSKPRTLGHFLEQADLVFAIGSSCTREEMTTLIPEGKIIMQSTIDELDINKDYQIEQAIIGDAKLVLKQLIEEIKRQTGSEGKKVNNNIAAQIKAVKDKWLEEWLPKLTSDEIPINPYRVIWDMKKVLGDKETIVVHDSGTPRGHLVPFWETTVPGGFFGYGKDHMLGSGLGLALGAKLASPEKVVVWVGGEGAFGQVGMDLETAVRENIPILAVIFNNGLLGGTGWAHPIAAERSGVNILSGNYNKIAEGLGAYSERIDDPNELVPAFERAKKAVNSGKATLLEVMDKEEMSMSR
jgi:acetolactate synthase-1/2/3 large subunit